MWNKTLRRHVELLDFQLLAQQQHQTNREHGNCVVDQLKTMKICSLATLENEFSLLGGAGGEVVIFQPKVGKINLI